MQNSAHLSYAALLSGLVALSLAACGGSGSDAPLVVTDISVPNSAVWEINRPIEIAFSQPVDFTSVNSNSISIRTLTGEPALGDYAPKLDGDGGAVPNVVVFQPRCPTEPDFSDAGLAPGNVVYTLEVLGADLSIGSPVHAAGGAVLAQSQQRFFTTPQGTTSDALFLDTKLGAPSVVVRDFGSQLEAATRIEVVPLDPLDDGRRYFELPPPTAGGASIAVQDYSPGEPDFPINLFSDPASKLSLAIVFDQAVSPSEANISAERIQLQYSTAAQGELPFSSFVVVDADVVLESNCTATGAVVRLIPIGILPQEAALRVEVSADFEDIVGEQGLNPANGFAHFRTAIQSEPLFDDNVLADGIVSTFAVGAGATGSLEQVETTFPEPRAEWGAGRLKAAFDFLGTGGPGGDFDWVIPSGATSILNTDTDVIVSATGQVQTVVNGVVNVANMTVEDGATLRITGSKPCTIYATGLVDVRGTIDVSGLDALPVAQLNAPNLPQSGGGVLAGSGKGGKGSPQTGTSSPKGEDGFGPGATVGAGGAGGEAGYGLLQPDESRRGGGGGGGSFADAGQLAHSGQAELSATAGFDGAPQAAGALDVPGGDGYPFGPGPQGGVPGPTVFVDGDPSNDFFGLMFGPGDDLESAVDDILLVGELDGPRAGPGGGGGGDSIKAGQFPPPSFVFANEKKGGGGGSGGGQLQLFALGDIRIGAAGRLVADGGNGGEGESTAGTNQIGGGGGGGAGGHVILQTAGQLDLTAGPAAAAISAVGGAGAVGQSDSPSGLGAGGAGGAGVIQIHLRSFDAAVLLPPGADDAGAYLDQLTQPNAWMLYPGFGPQSRARSIPIPLGAVAANTPEAPVLYGFGGLNLTAPALAGDPSLNAVNVTVGTVEPLAPLVTEDRASITAIDADARTLSIHIEQSDFEALVAEGTEYCYDGAGLAVDCSAPTVAQSERFTNDVYFRTPTLIEGFGVSLSGAGFPDMLLQVESASVVDLEPLGPGGGVRLDLVLASGEGTLVGVAVANVATFSLFPRFFRVSTGGQLDRMPTDQEIRIRLRGLGEAAGGGPDLATPLVDWTGNPAELSRPTLQDAVRYLQFEVTFDLDPDDDGGLNGNTALPQLEFLRIPIRF